MEAASVPRIPASAGALIFDPDGRLLILKPTYKRGWTIPGGQIETDDESPWEACRRETREECGLEIDTGRLVAVDFRPPGSKRAGGVRFVFDCGKLERSALADLRLQADEIEAYAFADLGDALDLLGKPLRRRVKRAAGRKRCTYLENGRRVKGMR